MAGKNTLAKFFLPVWQYGRKNRFTSTISTLDTLDKIFHFIPVLPFAAGVSGNKVSGARSSINWFS